MNVHLHQQALSSLLEKAINKALSLNSNTNDQLDALSGKTLVVQLAELGFPLCITVNQQQALVNGVTEHSNCVLTASISSLIELQKNQQLTELIKQDKLDITGDLKTAQQYASLFENITIDWQSELAQHIGEVPTYKITQFAKWLTGKFSFVGAQIQADASEWLVHEKRLVVTKSQVDKFCQQVTQITQRGVELEQRLSALTHKLATR